MTEYLLKGMCSALRSQLNYHLLIFNSLFLYYFGVLSIQPTTSDTLSPRFTTEP